MLEKYHLLTALHHLDSDGSESAPSSYMSGNGSCNRKAKKAWCWKARQAVRQQRKQEEAQEELQEVTTGEQQEGLQEEPQEAMLSEEEKTLPDAEADQLDLKRGNPAP